MISLEKEKAVLKGTAVAALIFALGLGAVARAGLVSYWPLDNSEANAVAGGPVGTRGGNAAFSTAQTAPGTGSTHSLTFDGSGDQFIVTGSADLLTLARGLQGDFTASLWARSDRAATSLGADIRNMVDFGAAHGSGVALLFNQSHGSWNPDDNGINGAGTIGFYYNNRQISSGVTGQADTWYHVALTRDGNDTTIHVDGTAAASKSISPMRINYSTSQEGTRGPFILGDQAKNGSRDWDGFIDEVAIWNRALSTTEIQGLANATLRPQDVAAVGPGQWVFENQTFNSATTSTAVGPWRNAARWRYKSNSTVTDHNYASSDISELPDFDSYNSGSSQWQMGGDSYPSVRISNGTIHPGNVSTNDKDVVVAWEADFGAFVDVNYQATGGNSVGYQMLQWDASKGEFRVLQQRETYNGSGTGPRLARTRVEAGDQILFVFDGRGNGNGDRATFHQTVSLSNGPQLGDNWVFENETFNDTSLAGAAGPWENSARWRYKTNSTVTNHNYASSGIGEFPDFDNYNSGASQWQMGGDFYPSVRISNGTLHPGNFGTDDKDAVVAWEADFGAFVDVNYQATGGNSVGYQMLQWDASKGEFRVLQQRETYNNSTTGPRLARTRVEPGDQILFVFDGRGNGNNDRATFHQTVSLSEGPVPSDRWVFEDDVFDNTGLADGAGPWRNSARWRYMTSDRPRDYAYSSPDDFRDFLGFASNTWRDLPDYQQVRISDRTLHAGPGQAVVAWEADFDGFVFYEFAPSRFYSSTTVDYQLLWWDADGGDGTGLMSVLSAREMLDLGEAPVEGSLGVGIGDMLYLVVDSHDSSYSNDRVGFAARITVAPEPATLTLLGLGGLMLLRRRKRSS